MNIQNGLSFNRNHYEYELVDIRNMDPEVFKRALDTAEKMLKDGVHIPLIHKFTGIPIRKLEKLAEAK